MKYPQTKVLGKTWVGWLNFLILQWAFVRLQGTMNDDDTLVSWDARFAFPLTGWWSSYWPKTSSIAVYKFKGN